jgi:hypothetical protein
MNQPKNFVQREGGRLPRNEELILMAYLTSFWDAPEAKELG